MFLAHTEEYINSFRGVHFWVLYIICQSENVERSKCLIGPPEIIKWLVRCLFTIFIIIVFFSSFSFCFFHSFQLRVTLVSFLSHHTILHRHITKLVLPNLAPMYTFSLLYNINLILHLLLIEIGMHENWTSEGEPRAPEDMKNFLLRFLQLKISRKSIRGQMNTVPERRCRFYYSKVYLFQGLHSDL